MANPSNPRGKLLALTTVAVAACVCGLVGYLLPAPEAGADTVYLRNSSGAVLFAHAGHQEATDACAVCHHELVGEAGPCADCHDDDYTPDLAGHDELTAIDGHSCEGCHELADSGQARGCRACHPAAAAEGAAFLGCDSCHDDDFGPDMATHAELLAIDGHECVGCHTPRSVADAYHAQCNACHLAAAATRFADAKGEVMCGACHLK